MRFSACVQSPCAGAQPDCTYFVKEREFEPPSFRGVIYDMNDNVLYGLVTYTPILTTPANTAPAFLWNVTLLPASPLSLGPATITLDFSRPMSTLLSPNVTFGLIAPYTANSFQGNWVSNTRWQGSYTVNHYTGEGTHHLRAPVASDADGKEITPKINISLLRSPQPGQLSHWCRARIWKGSAFLDTE